jgi:hypothetical protein
MSMHVKVVCLRQGRISDAKLDYWEGDPPAVGDLIDADGDMFVVTHRMWVGCFETRLLVKPAQRELVKRYKVAFDG